MIRTFYIPFLPVSSLLYRSKKLKTIIKRNKMNANNQHYGPVGSSGDSNPPTSNFFESFPENQHNKGSEGPAFAEAAKAILPGTSLLQDGSQYPVGNMNR